MLTSKVSVDQRLELPDEGLVATGLAEEREGIRDRH
jgi:hypothetical protein